MENDVTNSNKDEQDLLEDEMALNDARSDSDDGEAGGPELDAQ